MQTVTSIPLRLWWRTPELHYDVPSNNTLQPSPIASIQYYQSIWRHEVGPPRNFWNNGASTCSATPLISTCSNHVENDTQPRIHKSGTVRCHQENELWPQDNLGTSKATQVVLIKATKPDRSLQRHFPLNMSSWVALASDLDSFKSDLGGFGSDLYFL